MFFFIIPTGTDAPIYHWPFATGGLMLLNIMVFVFQCMFPIEAEAYILHFGTINPVAWVTAMFMHDGIFHLIGNLIVFLMFGWIIEGKVGWWRFILICLAIGISANAFVQVIMIWASAGGALGFSAVIYGLIAMAMMWAPENEMRMTCFAIVFFRPIVFHFDVSLSTLGFFMIGLEWIAAAIVGFSMSSAVGHLSGVVPGFLISYLMLRWRRVDCEGYDLITVWKGERGKRVRTVADEKIHQASLEEAKQEARREKETGLMMVDKYISAGHYDLAINRFNLLKKTDHSMVMTEKQYITLIQAFDSDESTKQKTVPLLRSYLEHYDRHKVPFTLMLARIHVLLQDRPRQGIKVLKTLTWDDLNAKQKDFVRRLLDRAKQMVADGVLEIDVE